VAQSRLDDAGGVVSKVAQATLIFWIVKICATTVGETGGDALSMSLNLGYLVSTAIFFVFLVASVAVQVAMKRFHPLSYWTVVVSTTTVGTTMSDYLDRTVGLGYVKSSAILFAGVIAVLVAWRLVTGHIAVDRITTRRNEIFYWAAIVVSNTLGTALGDMTATTAGVGFEDGALLFAGLIAVVAVLHFVPRAPQAILFWAAYVLTRPLGATLGDSLTKPHDEGGLALDRFAASGGIVVVMVAIVFLSSEASPLRRRPAPARAG
jgi:uncharacterized membrane-anchored protein